MSLNCKSRRISGKGYFLKIIVRLNDLGHKKPKNDRDFCRFPKNWFQK